jgi:hypothetical protein
MAKKKVPSPLIVYPEIPPEIWLPFTLALNGDRQHNEMAIARLADIFDIPVKVIRYRLLQELDEKRIMVQPESETLH